MKDCLVAYHALDGHELVIEGPASIPFYSGGFDLKQHITGTVDNTPASFIGRQFHCAAMRGDYLDTWQMLHESGQPVVPDAYFTLGNLVLLYDVKASGGELYGMNMLRCLRDRPLSGGYFRRRPEIDEQFFDLTSPSRIDELRDRVLALAESASEQKIHLAEDPFELFVNDTSHRILSLDLAGAHEGDSIYHSQRGNESLANDFIRCLEKIRRRLLATRPLDRPPILL
jgi:hypothetical protein